jgi:glutamate--cysteine ligase
MHVLVPLTKNLFANSKYFMGKPSSFVSERQNIWEHMDPTRSGFPNDLPFENDTHSVACAYAKWARNAYMLFLPNDLPMDEQPLYGELTFDQWMKKGFKGTYPTLADWETHLGTLFPHLRLRQFLEVRHIDAQPFAHTFAPIAFFTALIQCANTRAKTWQLIQKYNINPQEAIYHPTDFSFIHNPLLDLAIEILKENNEEKAAQSLLAYQQFLAEKENYWQTNTPLAAFEFVKRNATKTPSAEFVKYIS